MTLLVGYNNSYGKSDSDKNQYTPMTCAEFTNAILGRYNLGSIGHTTQEANGVTAEFKTDDTTKLPIVKVRTKVKTEGPAGKKTVQGRNNKKGIEN